MTRAADAATRPAGGFDPGIALVLLAATAYGFNTPFARLAHEAGLASPILVVIRGTAFLVLSAVVVRLYRVELRVPVPARWPVFVLGLTTTTMSLGYFGAVVFIPVSLAAIIFFTFPVLILAVSVFRGDVKATLSVWAVFGTVFFGLVLVIGPEMGELDWRGVALAVVTSLSGVAQFFAGAALGPHVDIRAAVFWSHLMVAPLALLAVLALDLGVAGAASAGWAAAGVVCVAYFIAYVSQLLALKRVAPARAGLFFNVEPVVTVLAAMAILGERLDAVQVAGAALVLGALVWSGLRERKRAPEVVQ